MSRNQMHIIMQRTLWSLTCAALWIVLLSSMNASQRAVAQPAASVEQLLAQGAEAGIDPALMEQVARRAEAAGYRSEQTAALLRPAVGLAQDQLPASGLLQKALEGLSKRVPAPRIQPVLQRMQAGTEQAGGLIRAWGDQPAARAMMGGDEAGPLRSEARHRLIESAAEAHMQDVPTDVVQQLLETLPERTQRRPIAPDEVVAAVQVLPELMTGGVSSAASIDLLTRAMEAGYGPGNVRQLPTAVQAARQQSQRPADVLVQNAARAISQGVPAADVLNTLFDGGLPGGPPSDAGGPPSNIPPGQGKPPDTPPGQGSGPPERGRTGQGNSST